MLFQLPLGHFGEVLPYIIKVSEITVTREEKDVSVHFQSI